MSAKLQPVRGTHDLLPEECHKHRFVADVARLAAQCYGYREMATPIFEFSEVFHRTLGDSSDVVTKETYSFEDRGGESITLRPEFTAASVRAFISNGLQQSLPVKWFYQGAAFRYERPQKGRQRQFHQFGAELLGAAEPTADVELIALAAQVLAELGLEDKVTLQLNSLGDSESRDNYRTALVEYFTSHEQELSPDSKRRLRNNPLRILDSKDKNDREICAGAPHMAEYFTTQSQEFFSAVQEQLSHLDIKFELNDKLVRGLDYYTHTVFEFVADDGLGTQNTVLAGGRYDGLIAQMGGTDTPGVGWAAGMERLLMLVDFANLPGYNPPNRPVAIIPLGKIAEDRALGLARELRSRHFVVELAYRGNLSRRMKQANRVNAVAAVIIGEEEINRGVATIRDMESGEQQEVELTELETALQPYK